jgi:GT2 family glycosyltransferase
VSNYKRTFKAPTPLDLREIKSLQQHRLIRNELIGLTPTNVSKLKENFLIRVIGDAAQRILKALRSRPKLFNLLRKHFPKLPVRIQSFVGSMILNHSSGNLIKGFAYSLVTIVIPVHNNWWVTYECLRYIQSGRNETPFEVVVVDDCSSDLTSEALGNIRGIHIITNTINLGYLHSTNLGASIASSSSTHILLLNNDTKPGINWLDELYRECEWDPKIAIAGSALVYPNGILQEAGSQIFRDGSGWNLGRGDSFPNPLHSTVREVDYCSAASVLVRKDFWESRGGYDVRFAPAYYEDTDLAFSARSLGFKVVCVPTSVVIHHEGLSHGVSVNSGLKSFQEINRYKFVDKWKLGNSKN